MSATLPQGLATSIQRHLSEIRGKPTRIVDTEPVTGGCIHRSLKISTDLGEDFFLKWSPDSTDDQFLAEADGLEALGSLRALRVPEAVGYSSPCATPSWLLLEFIPHGHPREDYWKALGRGLADIHQGRSEPYGWERSNYIGSLPQANDVTDDWADFWWNRRLLPQLTTAREGNRLPGSWSDWDRLEENLPLLLPPDLAEPSVVHGDLWSGNAFAGPSGEPVLVDPAIYRGHAEVDLAMTELFGGFPEAFYAAYASVRPVTDEYRDVRRSLYQLYPLLVHVNLFGGSYADSTVRSLHRVLGQL